MNALLSKKLLERATKLVHDASKSASRDMKRIWQSALDRIERTQQQALTKQAAGARSHAYRNRYPAISHAALLYLLRPRKELQRQTNALIQQRILSSFPNYDPRFSIGLPIRGTDKCQAESGCLSMDTYMDLAQSTWTDRFASQAPPGTRGSLVLTTEDRGVVEYSRQRMVHNKSNSFPLDLVLNDQDVFQGTGRPNANNYKARAQEVMFSTLVAIQLQLLPVYSVGNCCSNFHALLFDLRQVCSHMEDSISECLQEHSNPKYHVCCGWTHSDECDGKNKKEQNTTTS
eukprot:CAMPEP_0116849592 /NCGR_PEP_ID=MMETSP0418-20121206/15663_1 /TAXON_ID=1158023 /ORGANISM="Astrosyne radiata, Strain 13vi08-1A" /LENGTH=287 /DNA_ID=CAMNT_0004481341 /DNA_START=168 /DNA_END=1034 /DNA_ORIENTATION=+